MWDFNWDLFNSRDTFWLQHVKGRMYEIRSSSVRIAVNATLNFSTLHHYIHRHGHTYAWNTNTNPQQHNTHWHRPLCGPSGTELVGKSLDLPAVENTWLFLWSTRLWSISIYTEILCEMNINDKIAATWKTPAVLRFSQPPLSYLSTSCICLIYFIILSNLSVCLCWRQVFPGYFLKTFSKTYLKGSTWVI